MVQPTTRPYFQLLRSALAELFLAFVWLFVLILGHFCCSVATTVTFSSNLKNFNVIQQYLKDPKNQKIQKLFSFLISKH